MRKIITLLLAFVALSVGAQISMPNAAGHLKEVKRSDVPIRHFTNPNRSTTNVSIDYDSFDRKWAATHASSVNAFAWAINNRNTVDSTFTLDYAVFTMDTLIDVNSNFAGTAKQGATVRVDSFDLILLHDNQSGTNDTFIVSVFDKNNATVTGTGVNSNLSTTSLWADTIIFNADFFPTDTDFYNLTYHPNVTLPAGHVAGIKIEFRGPIADQLNVIASFREQCGATNFNTIIGDTNKAAPFNSSYYLNLAANSGFVNYTTHVAATGSSACKYFYIQNFWVFPYLTVNTPAGVTPPTVTTTAATNIAATTATLNGSVNANGNSTTTSFEYGLTTAYGSTATATPSPVTGSSANAISANITGLTANTLYHFRAKGVNGGGTTNGNDMTFTTLAAGTVCTPDAGVTSGMGPAAANVACVQQGVSYSQTYTFVIPAQVTSVTVDSVRNLPSGLTAQFSKTPPVYLGGETGCMIVTGTSNAPCGQYQMLIYVTLVTPLGPRTGELSALGSAFGFGKNWIRVISAGGTCPAVDNNQTATFAAGSCGVVANISATITKTDVQCFSESSGSATVTATGGSNYTYLWSNGATTQTISNVPGGTYTVTVTASGNATATASVTINTPASGVNASASATTTTCGQSTGTASVNPSGGTPGYTQLWSTGATTTTISGLAAGNYSVTVTDSHGCNSTATVQVTTPNGPSATTSVANANCAGGNGNVNVTVTGGTGTITYHWSNNATTQNLTGVAPGTYTLTVSDANSCSFTISATVSAPAAISLSGNTTNTSNGNNNGAVNLTATGGNGSFAYSWSNNSTNEDISNLAAGTYTVTVTDQNNCTATASFTVAGSVGIASVDMVNNFSVFPNPASTSVNVKVGLTESADMKVELIDLTGKVIITENAGKVSQFNYVMNTTAVPTGVYAIRVSGSKFNVVKQITITK